MRAPRSAAANIVLRDKKATAMLYAIAREGRSGDIEVAGKKFCVEPVGEYISRLAAKKRKNKS